MSQRDNLVILADFVMFSGSQNDPEQPGIALARSGYCLNILKNIESEGAVLSSHAVLISDRSQNEPEQPKARSGSLHL